MGHSASVDITVTASFAFDGGAGSSKGVQLVSLIKASLRLSGERIW